MPQRELARYHGLATIALDDGDRFEVECSYVVHQDMVDAGNDEFLEGLIGWSGTFTTEAFVAGPGAGTIELPDGRSGSILVTRLKIGPGGYGEFTGNGDAPA